MNDEISISLMHRDIDIVNELRDRLDRRLIDKPKNAKIKSFFKRIFIR